MQEFAERFYKGTAWQRTRAHAWARDRGLCQRCLKRGIIRPAEIVHHKIELTPENINDPTISLNHELLEYVCLECHNKEHGVFQPAERRVMFDDDGNVIDVIDREPRRPPPGR